MSLLLGFRGTDSRLNLHANVCVPANDRRRLERLCRYVARPPIASERLEQLSDGRLLYRLKHPWRDGTTHMVFTPMELMEKLAALVPAPRVNLVRYHGVLAPRSAWRDSVVPAVREPVAVSSAECCASGRATPCVDEKPSADDRSPSPTSPSKLSPSRYYSWPGPPIAAARAQEDSSANEPNPECAGALES